MSLFDWQQRYEIGNNHIDGEHKIFLALIKKLSTDLESGKGKDRVLRTFSELVKYTEFHFLSEENLMQDVEYPGYQSHKTLHEDLLSKLNSYIGVFQHDEQEMNDILHFLLDWFIRHTTVEDMNIGNFISDGNLTK